jgi:hypothetical protein
MMETTIDKIEKVAPTLKKMVLQHNEGSYPEGVEAFNASMTGILMAANLIEKRQVPIERVGVFPGNREGAMLVPVDMQQLALTFYQNGFNPDKWDAMALTVPACDAGKAWVQDNVQLVEGSQGLLPPISDAEILTGRGSHGTSALRAMKLGCKSIHPELAGSDGCMSIGKIVEKQPSLRRPIYEGPVYQIIPGELELAVPGIFQVLSRIGNASNSTFQLQTTLQHCSRIHSLAVQQSVPDWDKIARIASIGMEPGYTDHVRKYIVFVQAWSGGANAAILRDLEKYERTLTVRRKLNPDDLELLAKVDIVQAPKIVPVT